MVQLAQLTRLRMVGRVEPSVAGREAGWTAASGPAFASMTAGEGHRSDKSDDFVH